MHPHQRNLTPVDVKLSSELLVTADDGLHLLTAAQLVMWAFHLPQARREGNISTDHHIDARGEKRRRRWSLILQVYAEVCNNQEFSPAECSARRFQVPA